MKKGFLCFAIILLTLFASAQEVENTSVPDTIAQSDHEYSNAEIDRLKEAVIEGKLQMRLLRHLTRKDGIGAGSTKVQINYFSEMSNRYQIYSLTYKLDGENIYSFFYGDAMGRSDADKKPRPLSQPLAPGSHTLEVQVVHAGNDTGVFSYLNDYKILTEKKVSFEVKKEASTKIELISFEKGWILTDFKERPDLRIKINGNVIP